jgi:hypothetical protein
MLAESQSKERDSRQVRRYDQQVEAIQSQERNLPGNFEKAAFPMLGGIV